MMVATRHFSDILHICFEDVLDRVFIHHVFSVSLKRSSMCSERLQPWLHGLADSIVFVHDWCVLMLSLTYLYCWKCIRHVKYACPPRAFVCSACSCLRLRDCIFACLLVRWSACVSACLSARPSVFLSVCAPSCPSACACVSRAHAFVYRQADRPHGETIFIATRQR